MRKILLLLFASIILFSLIFSSWFVAHGDIEFSADIARDFLLLQELHEKKIVLIGPRSSTGLFHGPLWLYLNYPAYLFSGGNPLAIGWYWIGLTALFVGANYFIAKKLFNTTTAFLYVAMLALYMGFHTKGLYNPHGAMFVLPFFFFYFVRYLTAFNFKHLIAHILFAGALIQFQMAIGIPLFLLSSLAIAFFAIKSRHYRHVLFLPLIALTLINFFAFDLRHQNLLTQKVIEFVSPATNDPTFHYGKFLGERIRLMLGGSEILRVDPGGRNLILFLFLLFGIALQVKYKKFKTAYLSFLYLYIGFFVLSFINKGPILYFYQFPLFPLVFLMFSSLATSRIAKVFFVVFIAVMVLNIRTAVADMQFAENLIGKYDDSWKYLHSVGEKVFDGDDKDFGYFVYSPDAFGYEIKYALLYSSKNHPDIKASAFTKKPVTYVVAAPPPPNNPFMKDEWWRLNQVRIDKSPMKTELINNMYKIERYELSEEEINVPFDPSIDPGIHFR